MDSKFQNPNKYHKEKESKKKKNPKIEGLMKKSHLRRYSAV